jgi:hypothetical protein
MKLHTPDGNELMEVERIEREGDQLIIRGTIMGTMPTKAVLRPEQLRAGFSLLSIGLIFSLIGLLFTKRSQSGS